MAASAAWTTTYLMCQFGEESMSKWSDMVKLNPWQCQKDLYERGCSFLWTDNVLWKEKVFHIAQWEVHEHSYLVSLAL